MRTDKELLDWIAARLEFNQVRNDHFTITWYDEDSRHRTTSVPMKNHSLETGLREAVNAAMDEAQSMPLVQENEVEETA